MVTQLADGMSMTINTVRKSNDYAFVLLKNSHYYTGTCKQLDLLDHYHCLIDDVPQRIREQYLKQMLGSSVGVNTV